MKNDKLSRMVSVGILGIIAACAMHIHHARVVQMGREAFLTKQGARYDRLFAHPASIIIELIAGLFLLGVLFAAYELIALVVLKILEKKDAGAPNS
jgi:hypothetical protein